MLNLSVLQRASGLTFCSPVGVLQKIWVSCSVSLRLKSVTEFAGKRQERVGQLQSATPSMSKQFSASWSIGCGSKLRLPLVSESLKLCPWCFSVPGLVRPRGGAAIDREPPGPQAGVSLPLPSPV